MDKKAMQLFLPDSIIDVTTVCLDLDICDLSISDVLRNINKTFPESSKEKALMKEGEFAVFALCKTKTLLPLDGLIIIITNDDNKIEIASKNYIVLTISENRISNNLDIYEVIERLTSYLIKNYKESLFDFQEFYSKFVYDMTELRLYEQGV